MFQVSKNSYYIGISLVIPLIKSEKIYIRKETLTSKKYEASVKRMVLSAKVLGLHY